jgi:hypothetical protein
MTDAPDVQQLGPAILIQGDALGDLYLCIVAGAPVMSRNGHSTARLHAVKQHLGRALMAARGQSVADRVGAEQHSNCQGADDWMSIEEAAAVLTVTQRHARRLARIHQLGARVGSTWTLSRGAVLALKAERKLNAS